MKTRQIIVLAVWMGFLLTIPPVLLADWSLYTKHYTSCYEYRNGTEYIGWFTLPHDDGIANNGSHGDGEFLWSIDYNFQGGYHIDVALIKPYSGEILDEFIIDGDGANIAFDGEYLWTNYNSTISCWEIGGEPGPYPPFHDDLCAYGLEGYDGHLWANGIGEIYFECAKEYDRYGNVLREVPLTKPEPHFIGTFVELAIDPEDYLWVLYHTEWGDLYMQKYDMDGNLLGQWDESDGYHLGTMTCGAYSGVNINIQNTSLGSIKAMFSDGWNNNYNPLNDKDLFKYLENFGN